jgi:sigma-B regulation protein RsbU (phosphoserine phosphatase)
MAMHKGHPPREVFQETNRWLYSQMGDRYVAATYLLLDLQKMRITASNAGQPTYPLIVRDGKCISLEIGGLPLGIVDDAIYRQVSRQLQSGDLVLLFSDGVVEAISSKREMFGFDRMHELASECTQLSAQAAIEKIIATVFDFSAGMEQADDITIVALKVK